MSRYRALRHMGCDPLTAGVIALMNWAMGRPANEIHFMHMVIEVGDEPHPGVLKTKATK